MMHKKLKDNQFKKGNKKAREAGKKGKRSISLAKALKEMFIKEVEKKGKLTPDFFVKACALKGAAGNAAMARMIFEYIDGKVPENLNVKNEQTYLIVSLKEKAMLDKINKNE